MTRPSSPRVSFCLHEVVAVGPHTHKGRKMLAIPVIPTEAIVGALLQLFAIVSTVFAVAQISLLLLKKLLNDFREMRDQLRDLRQSPRITKADDSGPPA